MSALSERFHGLTVPQGQAAILWLGQGSFAYKSSSGFTLYVDPYLSNGLEPRIGWSRWFPPPIAPQEVRADLVLLTHNHLDHVDPDTIPGIAEHTSAQFAGPQSCLEHVQQLGVSADKCLRLEAGQSMQWSQIGIRATHADHMHPSAPTPDAISLVLELEGVRILHAADTTYRLEVIEPLRDLRPDVALVPINGRWGNMDGTDAAQYVRDTGARVAIPMHYGLLPANTADPKEFLEALKAFAPQARPYLMGYGEILLVGGSA